MSTRQEFIDALNARLAGLPEGLRHQLGDQLTELLDDRIDMGMTEADAVAALGNIDDLVRDYAPSSLVPSGPAGSAGYDATIREIHIHVKNGDAEIVSGQLPEGMTARIEASEENAFTWHLEDGVLTLGEVDEARRGLFKRDREVTLTLAEGRAAKLIADSYGGDIEVSGIHLDDMAVLASSSGDIEMKRVTCGGRTELTTRSGDLELTDVRVEGDCKLEAMSGDVELTRVFVTSLRLRTASGDVEGKGLRANTAAVSTVSGDIEVDGIEAAASILCESRSGDIELEDAATPDLRLSTSDGDIELRLPRHDEGYAIEAQSRGEVEVPDMPVTGDDPRRVAVVSENGDIEIRIA